MNPHAIGANARTSCPECGRVMRCCNLARHRRVHELSARERLGPTDDEQRRIVELYGNGRGLTMEQIALEVAWSSTVVWRVLHAWGAYVQHGGSGQRLSNEEMLRTAELYARGMTIHQITDVLERNPETIRRRLKRFGVQLRKRGPKPDPTRPHSRRRRKRARQPAVRKRVAVRKWVDDKRERDSPISVEDFEARKRARARARRSSPPGTEAA